MDDLIDTGLVPDIYVDDVGAVENLGDCFRTVYFTWARAPGGAIFCKIVVAKLIRPKRALHFGKLQAMLTGQPKPEFEGVVIQH